jgi:geranylgeranyl diphosphate synthase type I
VTHPAVPALDAEDLRQRVQKVLDDFLARQLAVLEEVSPACAPLVEAIGRLLSGGKRLRPAFCYWGWRGAGGEDTEQIITAATALELFQAAALIHDDVMDSSDTRRGMPALHRQFSRLHRTQGWDGDADRFGTAAAVLAGDLCLGWSDELLLACGLAADRLARGAAVFERMRTQLMGGQYLDVLEQAIGDGAGGPTEGDPVQRARRVIRFKSAKYTIEHPMLLGGTLAGADPGLLDAYSAYALPLGEAFQLRDDVLGVFGDPATTGKPAGDDLREGKRTVLVALSLARADAAQAARMRRLLGDPDLTEEEVDAARELMVDTGALAVVEQMVSDLGAEALEVLHASAVSQPARDVLTGLVEATTARAA